MKVFKYKKDGKLYKIEMVSLPKYTGEWTCAIPIKGNGKTIKDPDIKKDFTLVYED